MLDFVESNLASWIAATVGLVALALAVFVYRRPITNITFGKNWFVGYDRKGKLRVVGKVAISPLGSSFVIMEHGCKVRFRKLEFDLSPKSDFSGAVNQGGKVVPLDFEGESVSEDAWKSRMKLDVWVVLADGSTKHFRHKYSRSDTELQVWLTQQ